MESSSSLPLTKEAKGLSADVSGILPAKVILNTLSPDLGPTAAADDRTIGREQVVRRQFIIDDGLSDLGDDALSFTILDGICLLLELGDFPVEVDQ